jgi:hypothetical protein
MQAQAAITPADYPCIALLNRVPIFVHTLSPPKTSNSRITGIRNTVKSTGNVPLDNHFQGYQLSINPTV